MPLQYTYSFTELIEPFLMKVLLNVTVNYVVAELVERSNFLGFVGVITGIAVVTNRFGFRLRLEYFSDLRQLGGLLQVDIDES